MKNQLRKFLFKRDSGVNLTCVILMLLAVVLGCSDSGTPSAKTPEKTIPPAYVGMWTGADGSTLTIRNDGSGDYKSGGSSMSGGSVEVDEAAKEIRFSLLLFDSKYKIDEPPKKNRMKLDGMEYRRTGGFDTSSEQKDETVAVPTENELRPLVYKTLTDLNQAVQSGDFAEFYETIAEKWQNQTSITSFNESFAGSIKNKNNYEPKSEAALDFESKPFIENEKYFNVTVKYVTVKGTNPKIQLKYLRENEEWKLFGIEISLKRNEK